MSKAKDIIDSLLKQNGAKLIRQKKHYVWKLPDGRKWTVPKTPSDSSAFQNNLGELKLFLGIRSTVKVQKDFDHVQKEEYKPEVDKKETFLGTIPEREERILPEPAPSKFERAAMALGVQQPPEKVVRTFGGRVPVRLTRHVTHHVTGRHGKAFTYSPEILANASFILNSKGPQAYNDYLNRIREGKPTVEIEISNTKIIEEAIGMDNNSNGNSRVRTGSIEEELRFAKEKVQEYKKKEVEAREEWQRFEQVAVALQQALTISLASRGELQKLISGENQVQEKTKGSPKKEKGYWRNTIKEVVQTTPVQLTTRTLIAELAKLNPESNHTTVAQVVYKAMADGWLVKGERDLLRYIETVAS